MKNFKFYSLFLMLLVFTACNSLNEKQLKSAEEAITALKKLTASTEIGINKSNYSTMLVNAKASVNQASETLPDGELKQEIKLAMESYTDALALWQLGDGAILVEGNDELISKEGVALQKKYNIPIDENVFNPKLKNIRIDNGLTVIWKTARNHTEKASSLLN